MRDKTRPATTPGTATSAGPGFCVLRDYDLRTIPSVVTGKDATRILQQGIEKYFQVSITLEERTTDVYVMTALECQTPKEADPTSFATS